MIEEDLGALLVAYIDGDILARKALVDILEEAGDPRCEAVRQEAIDWDRLARDLASDLHREPWDTGEAGYIRFLIECARYGSPTRPEVVDAVRGARRQWARNLFPEVAL